jgi:hypothetical protein
MAKFKLKNYLPTAFFSKQQIRKFFIVTLIPLALFLVIYIPVKAYINYKNTQELASEALFIRESSRALTAKPTVYDFMFTGGFLDFSIHWQAVRPVTTRWSDEEVEKYWIDPSAIGLGNLEKTNEALLLHYLDSIIANEPNLKELP